MQSGKKGKDYATRLYLDRLKENSGTSFSLRRGYKVIRHDKMYVNVLQVIVKKRSIEKKIIHHQQFAVTKRREYGLRRPSMLEGE